MKCRVCGQPASISLRSHKTAFCNADFLRFFEKRTATAIRKYGLISKDDTPIVAVSGGKDSLSLWSYLNRAGYAADGIYVDLGIGDYSRLSLEKIKAVAEVLERKVYVFHVRDIFHKGIDGIARAMRRPPCSACGMIKRYVMNRVCMDKGYNLLLTGHNLDDEAAALFGNILYWKQEYLWKKDIILDEKEGHLSRKAKPFFLCSEREVAAYAIISGIDYVYEECPFSKGAKTLVYKEILNKLEETSPGTKLRFVKGYLKELRHMKVQEGKDLGLEEEEGFCATCAYPAPDGQCGFCRALSKFELPYRVEFEEYG